MKKIVNIPLDERPCTYDYPIMIGSQAKDINLVSASRDIMGDLKVPGDVNALKQFLLDECKDADYAIIALDTILYGGIVPSRLHYETEETLLERLDVLRKIKEINKNIKLFAYHLIMRCPSYSGDDEEPDYYALCGRQIHNIEKYKHLSEISTLTTQQQDEYDACLKFIKDNGYEKYHQDYLARRVINTNMNNHSVKLVSEGIIDFLVIPQDDSAPYGITAKDQMKVRKQIIDLHLENKVLMYPDADAVSNTLLARAINHINNVRPLVYVRYSSCNEGNIIPNYEDRPVSESIKYQILAAGGLKTPSFSEADIVMMVNVPLNNMRESRNLYDDLHNPSNPGENTLSYTVGRNLVEYVEFIKHLIDIKKCVAVADIAYANGGDTILFNMLKNEHLLFKINSYAGWNTAANTIGTCLPEAMVNNIYKESQEHLDFLGLRYLEDCGYQSEVRLKAFDKFKKEGFVWKQIDGKRDGVVATYIRDNLIKWCSDNLCDEEYEVSLIDHYQPWNRFFETGIKVKVVKK